MVHHLLGGVWDPHIPGASVRRCGDVFDGRMFYIHVFLSSSLECFPSGIAVRDGVRKVEVLSVMGRHLWCLGVYFWFNLSGQLEGSVL